jgi:predicted RNA methylase
MTWSDFGDQKGFHIFDTNTRELTFVPNPHTMFHKLHYDDADKQISDVVNIDFSVYSETFVKLIVRNKTNPYCFDMFVDKLEKAGVHSVQVVDDHFHMDVETDDEIISEAEDTMTILSKYVGLLDDTVDKQPLDVLLRELYHEALSVE